MHAGRLRPRVHACGFRANAPRSRPVVAVRLREDDHYRTGAVVRSQLGPKATSYAVHQLTTQEEGLTKPIPVQYGLWLWRVLHGNLGFSYVENTPVTTLLVQYFPRTLVRGGFALLLTLVLAVPLGMLQGSRRNGRLDYSVSGGLFTAYSTPTFLLGAVPILVFSIWLGLLPDTTLTFGRSFGADVSALVLPVLTLTVGNIAFFSRYVRSSVIDNLDEDYVRAARAKGVGRTRILFRHVLRNSLLPFVSVGGVAEGEHPAVRADQPVPAAVGSRRDPDDRSDGLDPEARKRAVEGSATVGEYPAPRLHQPVALAVRGARDGGEA